MEFDIRVQPKAGRNSVEIDGDKVTARVTAAPEDGKANDAVVALQSVEKGAYYIAVHAGEQVDDQPAAGRDDFSQNQAEEKGHGSAVEVGAAVLEHDAFEDKGGKYAEPHGAKGRADGEAEGVEGPPEEFVVQQF